MTANLSSLLDALDIAFKSNTEDTDYSGWFTLKTDPYTCECNPYKVWEYPHIKDGVLVWEEKDDETLLRFAAILQKRDWNPCIIDYEPSMGKAIPAEVINWPDVIRMYD